MSLSVLSSSELYINQFYFFFVTEPKMIGLMFSYQLIFLLLLCLIAMNILDFSRVTCKHLNHYPDKGKKGRMAQIIVFFFNAEENWLTTGWPSMVLLMFLALFQKITTLKNGSKKKRRNCCIFPFILCL